VNVKGILKSWQVIKALMLLQKMVRKILNSGSNPQNMSYLISADLLRFWYLTKHNMPGTSMDKFIETLETLFDGQKPVITLNILL
jgi:hypothetical protein